MSTATQTEKNIPLKADKSIGGRVAKEEFGYIKGLATAFGISMSDWILDRISMTTEMIELESVVLESLQKRLTDID